MTRVLILGGTAEGTQLAEAILAKVGLEPIYSLAGVTRSPNLPDCQVRTGGFGGVKGLAYYLREEKIDKVVDVTHPYAARMAAHAAAACGQENIPRIKLLRPAWVSKPGDDWRIADDAAEAAALLQNLTDRVFLATGRKDLAAFAPLSKIWFLVRLVDAPPEDLPLANHQLVLGRGPFKLDAEKEMLSDHQIGAVVSKNSGGGAYAKIEAARELGLPVVMINRPQAPAGTIVESMNEVMAWL
jgi:precorrin-6A/cobalt-precorrin-6A reductase